MKEVIYTGFLRKPKEGEKIKITYLPPFKNMPNIKNLYIGFEGEVQYMQNGRFRLNGAGNVLLMGKLNSNYKYKII